MNPVDRLTYSPAEAAEALGLSRARIYQLLQDGTLPSIKIGRRRMIKVADLQRYIDSLEGPYGNEEQ